MHKIIAKSDEQLGIALRLAYAYQLPYSVKGIMNDDHKINFHITVKSDNEEFEKLKHHCEIQFAAENF